MFRLHTQRLLLLFTIAGVLPSGVCLAQDSLPRPSSREQSVVAERMARARQTMDGLPVVELLSKLNTGISDAVRAEATDSMVGYLMAFEEDAAASSALRILFRFTLTIPLGEGVDARTPKVTNHLLRLADSARSLVVRRESIYDLGLLPDQTQAFAYLERIATSDNPAAHAAVFALAYPAPPGLEVLKRLFLQGSIREPRAVAELNEVAKRNGWTRPP